MKDMNPKRGRVGIEISRRALFAGGAAVATIGAGQMANAEQPNKTAIEIANETLVNNFCRDWALRDVDKLLPYLAEDLFYQMAPGRPMIESRAAFEKQIGPFLKNLESVEFEMLRSHVIGPIVLNERMDYFNAPEGGRTPTMRFHVVGDFFIEDGVIKVWKDWPMPGSKPFIG